MQEMQLRSLGRQDPLEKETATRSSILAWAMPWTEEPTVRGVAEGQTRLSKLSLHQHQSTHAQQGKHYTCSEENRGLVMAGLNAVLFRMVRVMWWLPSRDRKEVRERVPQIWRKERYRRKKQPVQKSWGGYTLDVFNKHERLLWRLVQQGG